MTLLSLLLLVFVLLLIICLTRVQADVTWSYCDRAQVKAAVRLLGGVTPPILVFDSAWEALSSKPETPRGQETRPGRKKQRPEKKRVKPRLVCRALPQLLTDLHKHLDIKEVSGFVRFGFKDPADTGHMFGILAPTFYSTYRRSARLLQLEPDFSGRSLQGRGKLCIAFRPVFVLMSLSRFGWCVFGGSR